MCDKTWKPEAEFFWYLDIGFRAVCLLDWKRRRLLFLSRLSSHDELSANQTPWELGEKSNAADNRAKADNAQRNGAP